MAWTKITRLDAAVSAYLTMLVEENAGRNYSKGRTSPPIALWAACITFQLGHRVPNAKHLCRSCGARIRPSARLPAGQERGGQDEGHNLGRDAENAGRTPFGDEPRHYAADDLLQYRMDGVIWR